MDADDGCGIDGEAANGIRQPRLRRIGFAEKYPELRFPAQGEADGTNDQSRLRQMEQLAEKRLRTECQTKSEARMWSNAFGPVG